MLPQANYLEDDILFAASVGPTYFEFAACNQPTFAAVTFPCNQPTCRTKFSTCTVWFYNICFSDACIRSPSCWTSYPINPE